MYHWPNYNWLIYEKNTGTEAINYLREISDILLL